MYMLAMRLPFGAARYDTHVALLAATTGFAAIGFHNHSALGKKAGAGTAGGVTVLLG